MAMIPRRSRTLPVNAAIVVNILFSGTMSGTMIKDAATRIPARTIKNHVSPAPVARFTMRHTRIGIEKIKAIMLPANALFLLKNLAWEFITSSFSLTIFSSMVTSLISANIFLQEGHSPRCSSTILRVASLQISSLYNGRRSEIKSQLYFIFIHPFLDL